MVGSLVFLRCYKWYNNTRFCFLSSPLDIYLRLSSMILIKQYKFVNLSLK